jgi:hypothetical protein
MLLAPIHIFTRALNRESGRDATPGNGSRGLCAPAAAGWPGPGLPFCAKRLASWGQFAKTFLAAGE